MRNRFDEQLFELNREIIEIGAMCEESISKAVQTLNGNKKLIAEVKRIGISIDQMEKEIENRCMRLLLHQQPVARDFRLISSALKMITDMERIGDQAEDIAEIANFFNSDNPSETAIINDMAQEAIKMVTKSVDAFVKRDLFLAEQVIEQDDIVDDYFSKVKNDIINLIANNTINGEIALDLLIISKYLERIGDHATNIAEWVIYSVTGVHKEV